MTTRATSDTTRATTEIRSEADELFESAISQVGKEIDVEVAKLHQAVNPTPMVSVSLAAYSLCRWICMLDG